MTENTSRADLKKIKLMQRKMSTKLKRVMCQNVSLLDSSLFESQLKLMDDACDEVTNVIDEMIQDFDESDEDHDEIISDLEERKDKTIETLMESRDKFVLMRNQSLGLVNISEVVQEKNETSSSDEPDSDVYYNIPEHASLTSTTDSTSKKSTAQILGESVAKRGVKKIITKEELASSAGEGILELATDDPSKVVLELLLGSIGAQLGVKGTKGFLAAALTHYAISQFAVLVGVVTTPVKMDFSGITQAKILKKLEDLNKKVDILIKSKRIDALNFLKDGLLELGLETKDYGEAKCKFEKVRDLATKALSREEDFTNIAVCTKYLLFAETMVQSFTDEYIEGEIKHEACFLPIEKMTNARKSKMVAYLEKQIKDLKSKMKTKGKKKEDHRDKVDDILKMVYNIISICKGLSNPSTPIHNEVTFGIDTEYIPYGEEDATVLQVGRIDKETKVLNPKEMTEEQMKETPVYIVYLWRDDKKIVCVRRHLQIFEIPIQKIPGSLVWIQLEEKEEGVNNNCMYGDNKKSFERTCEFRSGYPKNIQKMDALFEAAKTAKDLDALKPEVYNMMQRISDVYLADLGININEKDVQGKTLLHYVACLKPGWSGKWTPIDCLVDAGADLASQDPDGKTPLMAALSHGSALEKNIRKLIDLCEGTPAIHSTDNNGNNVLHQAASLKESTFTKEIVKVLLKVDASHVNANHFNVEGFNPRDTAHYNQNWKVKKILED